MQTPICDFVNNYINSNPHRLHMPGHKGEAFLGCEFLDLTEIEDADYLYSAEGIISQSMANATKLFDSYKTFYSTEGSSLCIKAMLKAAVYEHSQKYGNERPLVIASRNTHKAFIYSAILLDFDIEWIQQGGNFSLCKGDLSPKDLENTLENLSRHPAAVYVTTPDYLGGACDVSALSEVARKYGIPLLVDNAHGAYLNFLSENQHPIHKGAYMCCDSAHKTLPVLTGGAYLHLSDDAKNLAPVMGMFMETFGSTSPSYLVLQSLDLANKYLNDGFKEDLETCIKKIDALKEKLQNHGFEILKSDPLKLTIAPKSFGYSGFEIASVLKQNNGHIEYADPDYAVIMLTPQNRDDDFEFIYRVLTSLNKKDAIKKISFSLPNFERVLSPFEASKLPFEMVNISESVGKIASSPNVGCPPAVSVVTIGERISRQGVEIMKYYGIETIEVIHTKRS